MFNLFSFFDKQNPQNFIKLFTLIIFIVSLNGCGFYLRGFNSNQVNNKNVNYIQIINFNQKLAKAIIERAQGVQGLIIAETADINPDNSATRIIKITDENVYENENLLDATTYNKENRISIIIHYKIQNPAIEQIQNLQDLIIERRATVNYSEADRLSAEIKIDEVKNSLYNEIALSLLQNALRK